MIECILKKSLEEIEEEIKNSKGLTSIQIADIEKEIINIYQGKEGKCDHPLGNDSGGTHCYCSVCYEPMTREGKYDKMINEKRL